MAVNLNCDHGDSRSSENKKFVLAGLIDFEISENCTV